jgi:hypothetical protein
LYDSKKIERSFAMNKAFALVGGALLMAGAAVPALGENMTVTGQLIDLGNYAAGHAVDQYTGVHARACALEGFDVGLLASDGKVYKITGDFTANVNAKLIPHILAKTVTVSGDVTQKDGWTLIAATDVR